MQDGNHPNFMMYVEDNDKSGMVALWMELKKVFVDYLKVGEGKTSGIMDGDVKLMVGSSKIDIGKTSNMLAKQGWIKYNTDGASKGNPGSSSWAFCLRNVKGT